MSEKNRNGSEQYGTDEDLIGVLTAISVTSKHLARELINSSHEDESAKRKNNGKHLKKIHKGEGNEKDGDH